MNLSATILNKSQMPKLRPLPMVDGAPHREWELLEDWILDFTTIGTRFFIPKGFIFNGASVPRVFSNIYPATGYLFIAALIHDFLYQHGYYLEVLPPEAGGTTDKVMVTKAESDQIFKDISNWLYAKHSIKTGIANIALKIGGFFSWNKYRKIDGTYVPAAEYKYWGNDSDGMY